MDTVAEFALRRRVAELERELMLARAAQPEPVAFMRPGAVTAPTVVDFDGAAPMRLQLASRWQCDYDLRGRLIIRGQSWCDEEPRQFGMQYYLDEKTLLNPNDALYILGKEHERVVRQIGKYYKVSL